MKRKMTKIISVALCVAMAVSMLSVGASAAKRKTVVAIGDSVTMDFPEYRSVKWGSEWKNEISATYADQLASKFGYTVDTALQYPGMRSTDLYYLLCDTYTGDDYTRAYYPEWFEAGSTVREDAQEAAKNASIVTMQMGYPNWVSYFLDNVLAMAGLKEGYSTDLSKVFLNEEIAAADQYVDEFMAVFEEAWGSAAVQGFRTLWNFSLSDIVKEQMDEQLGEEAWILLNLLLNGRDELAANIRYTVVSMIVDFERSVAAIQSLNPDVPIYIMGLTSLAYDLELTYQIGGQEYSIPVGEVMAEFFDLINQYYKAFASQNENCYYVENADRVQCYGDTMVGNEAKTRQLLATIFKMGGVADYEEQAAEAAPGFVKILDNLPFSLNEIITSLPQTEASSLNVGDAGCAAQIISGSKLNVAGQLTASKYEQFIAYVSAIYGISAMYVHPTQKGHDAMAEALLAVVQKPEEESAANFFLDVPTGAYYEDAVQWALDNDVTSGTSSTTFSPKQPCTRAQMVTFLWRAAGEPEVDTVLPFRDVASDAYYADAVAWAYWNGITSGTTATTFSPDATCTRAQMVQFLYNYKGTAVTGGKNVFTDVKNSDYYYNAVQWAVKYGITTGTSATTFSPNATCTRADGVTFLHRLFDESARVYAG